MKPIQDVAVLGAGLAGSSLAKIFADKGWDTILIDRHSFPRHKVCGEFLSPESQGTLSELRLLEAVESLQPSRISGLRIIFNDNGVIELPLSGNAYGVSRFVLDNAFHEAALKSGVQLLTSTTITSVDRNDLGYVVEANQGGKTRLIKARAVIAAWGANPRSGLPSHRPSGFPRDSYMGVKSHFQGVDLEPVVELYVFPGGYLGISPIEGGRVNVAALMARKKNGLGPVNKSGIPFHSELSYAYANTKDDPQALSRNRDLAILDMLGAAASNNSRLYDKLLKASPVSGTQAAVAPVNLYRKPAVWDKIPHVGDAALMIPPLCGDGMSLALRSALYCSTYADSYLRGNISLACWQHEYTQSIQRNFMGPLRWGRLLHRLFDTPLLPGLLPALAKLAPGLAIAMLQATRLKR